MIMQELSKSSTRLEDGEHGEEDVVETTTDQVISQDEQKPEHFTGIGTDEGLTRKMLCARVLLQFFWMLCRQ